MLIKGALLINEWFMSNGYIKKNINEHVIIYIYISISVNCCQIYHSPCRCSKRLINCARLSERACMAYHMLNNDTIISYTFRILLGDWNPEMPPFHNEIKLYFATCSHVIKLVISCVWKRNEVPVTFSLGMDKQFHPILAGHVTTYPCWD